MYKNFKSLEFHTVKTSMTYFRPRQDLPERVTENEAAINAMTDLRQVTLLMVSLTTPLHMAKERMIKGGVRMLLVADPDGTVRGLLTSRDVEGERPQKILEKTGGIWEDLLVRDIMTLKGKLQVLTMEDVRQATVGDIIATLREADRQHAMVADTDPHTGNQAVRGIFSLSQIARQLGLNIDSSLRATTFADLEGALKDKLQNFKTLPFHTPKADITYFRPRQDLPERVTENEAAINVMTDLRQVTLLLVSLTAPLRITKERMIKGGVRMLLVADPDGTVRGLLTSRDVEGERPQKILEKTGEKWGDLLVEDIMTLKGKLEVLMMEDVLHAKVGDIIATLREADRQHAMVADTDPHTGNQAVRGIFSLSQIARQLGLNIDPSLRATTFADLEQALTKPL